MRLAAIISRLQVLRARVALEHGTELRARAKRSFFFLVLTTLKAMCMSLRVEVFIYNYHDYVGSYEPRNLA